MSKSLPYYPYYVTLFNESRRVRSMTLAEVGLYQLALNEGWQAGSIPDDHKQLAVDIRRDPKEVKKSWTKVRECFVENGTPGRLINPRQEIERAKALSRSEKATEAARIRHGSTCSEDANASPQATTRAHANASGGASASERERAFVFSSASTTNKIPEKTKPKILTKVDRVQQDEDFLEFKKAYTESGGPAIETDWAKAAFPWLSMDFEQKNLAISHVKTCEGSHLKLPQNYLSDREWTRPVRAESKSKLDRMIDSL